MLKSVKEGSPKAPPLPKTSGPNTGTQDCVPRGAAINAVHMTRVLEHGQGDSAVEQLKVIPSGGKQETGI